MKLRMYLKSLWLWLKGEYIRSRMLILEGKLPEDEDNNE